MKNRTKLWVDPDLVPLLPYLIWVACLFWGCAAVPSRVERPIVYSVGDETGADFGVSYYFFEEECFVSVYEHPSRKRIGWYYTPKISPSLRRTVDRILAVPGSRIGSEGGFRKRVYFSGFHAHFEFLEERNRNLIAAFETLKVSLVREEFATLTVPLWIRDNSAIPGSPDLR